MTSTTRRVGTPAETGKPGVVVNGAGHWYEAQAAPSNQGVITGGIHGRGSAKAAGNDGVALGAALSNPVDGPVTDETGT